MHKKMAQHIEMQVHWGLYKLLKSRWADLDHEVNLYESAHSFGFQDSFDESDYTHFIETDAGFKAIWSRASMAFDEMRDELNKFCDAMVAFTDGQVDFKTAKTMATNPRTEKELDELIKKGVRA